MVNPGKRMHVLKDLLQLRLGPGAALLPPGITRIHLDFAAKWNDGHLGPRKFWRSCLPRLKYWNPAIPMLVNRSENQAGPALMSIYFRQSGSKSGGGRLAALPLEQQPYSSTTNETPAPPPDDGERVVTIEMKHQSSDTILSEFLQKTGATVVEPTPDELVQMREVEELQQRGAVDRAIVKKFMDAKRKDQALVARAREEAEAIKRANES